MDEDIHGAAEALREGLEVVLDLCEAGVAPRDVARCVRELAWAVGGTEAGAELWGIADGIEETGDVEQDHRLALGVLFGTLGPKAPAIAPQRC